MITFDHNNSRFTYRVAGVALHAGRVLLNTVQGFDFWFLPGGRCELREAATEALMREMRAINFVTRLIDGGIVDGKQLNRVFIHSIFADSVMKKLGASSKLNADWDFLRHLHAAGRETADAWIEASFDRLGVASTVDIRAQYL